MLGAASPTGRTTLGSVAGLRICLVTPFAWSQPHDVNEHVAGVAEELRRLGHSVTILASSNRARDLAAGRRALLDGLHADLVALGPAVPISRRSRIGVPVGARANLSLALALGRFDVVHGFEPGLPSLSYLALRDAQALTVATFVSPDRLGYPPGRAQRERLLARLDALVAASDATAEAAVSRFPGSYHVVSPGVDLELFEPREKRPVIVSEWRPAERPLNRSVLRALEELPDWELVFLRTKPLTGRPTIPRELRGRVTVRTARDGKTRAQLYADAAIFVPALAGLARASLEAAAAGCAIAAPAGTATQPELAGAEVARLAEDPPFRERRQREARERAETQSFSAVARELEDIYESLARRRRPPKTVDPLAERDWILCDLHMHTSWSHDCTVDPADLVMYAEAIGLGAIAVTDHNVSGGALETAELARGHDLVVIPGEEIKTDGQGEVIGLFLQEEIPGGLSFPDTIAAIHDQGGLVYLPHPFDRLHSIPDPATLHRHLADIDVFEVYNARLLFESYNDEAMRFATKYNLTVGAGSDAHVLQGVGTGGLRMRAFDGPEEFLLSLRSAQVLRRPRSLVYLQSLKWMAQAKERVR
ncbi:MAG: PHP domain-containing protein [Actinobacteria bacterium]|nr:MAG: PHP domain-containing protein [Actinomycetota bacterium]